MTLCVVLPDEVREIYERIVEWYGRVVFTGSRAIGCPREGSDWDFVVSAIAPINIDDLTPDSSYASSLANVPHFTSIRYGSVNLIVDHRGDDILDNWEIATNYCIDNCVYEKDARIKAFDMFGAG